MKKLKTEEGETLLRKLLKESGFNWKAPDVRLGWETFKKMCDHPFDCAGDGLLFETGTYDFTGEKLFYLSFVRQFTIEVEEEYDYMEQLHLDFTFAPSEKLDRLKGTIWTYDCDEDFQKFFRAVEASQAFREILAMPGKPVGAEVYFEEL